MGKVSMKAATKTVMKKAAMKKAAMKKAMKKSKIAAGRLAKALVLRGAREKTSGGLRQSQIMKNKRGKVVSKMRSEMSRKKYKGSKLEAWTKAVKAARKELGITGLVDLNGKTAQGRALYAKAKANYTA